MRSAFTTDEDDSRAAPRDPSADVSGSSTEGSPRRKTGLLTAESTLRTSAVVLVDVLDELRALRRRQRVVNFLQRRDDHRCQVLYVLRSRVRERLQGVCVEVVGGECGEERLVGSPIGLVLRLDRAQDVRLRLLRNLALLGSRL